MGETAQQPTRTPIPHTASLREDPDRLERMWAMSPADRLAAAQRGEFTLGEMLRWASRRPREVPLVDGDFFFISAYLVDSAAEDDEGTGDSDGFWEGEYTPLPETRDVSRDVGGRWHTSTERSR